MMARSLTVGNVDHVNVVVVGTMFAALGASMFSKGKDSRARKLCAHARKTAGPLLDSYQGVRQNASSLRS